MGCIHNQKRPQHRGPPTQTKPDPKPQSHLKGKPIKQSVTQHQQLQNAKNPQSSPNLQDPSWLNLNYCTPVEVKVSQAVIPQAEIHQKQNIKHINPQIGSKEDQRSLIEISGKNLKSKIPNEKVEESIHKNIHPKRQLPPSILPTPAKGEDKAAKSNIKSQSQLGVKESRPSQQSFGGINMSKLSIENHSDIEQNNNKYIVKQVVPSGSKIPYQNKTGLQTKIQSNKRVSKSLLSPPLMSPPSKLRTYSRIAQNGSEIKDSNPNDYVIQVHSVHDEDSMMMPSQQQNVHDQEMGAPLQGLLWRSKLAAIS